MLLGRAFTGVFVLGVAAIHGAVAAGDITRGERVFRMQCAGCHSVAPDDHRAGPSLHNVLNRPAGHVDGFDYSPALREADIVWTPGHLDTFLADPEDVVPGTRMVFWGLDARERELVIRYLGELSE